MSIETLQTGQIDIILTYGIGSFILTFLSFYAIMVYQMYEQKNNNGNIPYYTIFLKIIYFYTIILMVIFIFLIVLTVVSHSQKNNPVVGIYGFFQLNWADINTSALDKLALSPAYNEAILTEKESLVGKALIVVGFKILYEILLISSFVFYVILGFFYPYTNCRREMEAQGDANSFGHCMYSTVIPVTLYFVLIFTMLNLHQRVINYIYNFAKDNGYVSSEEFTQELDHIKNIKDLSIQVKDYIIEETDR